MNERKTESPELIEQLTVGPAWSGHKVNYTSLSAVARAITGTRWNGKVFFGVK